MLQNQNHFLLANIDKEFGLFSSVQLCTSEEQSYIIAAFMCQKNDKNTDIQLCTILFK